MRDIEEEEYDTRKAAKLHHLKVVGAFDDRPPLAQSAAQFYASASELVLNHALNDDETERFARALMEPFKRGVIGRPSERNREMEIWLDLFTFVGTIKRGGKMGDPLPTRQEALEIMRTHPTWRFNGMPDTARKVYDRLAKDGPPDP